MTKPNSNDLAISFFKQKVFLQKLKKELNDPEKVKEIQENLHSLRKYLVFIPNYTRNCYITVFKIKVKGSFKDFCSTWNST